MAGFLTNSGLAKLAVATPLAPMTVKYMAFDAGQGTPSATMTALFNEVYRTEIPNPTKDPDNPKNLTFTGFVPTTVGGWTIYGIGLFDSLGVLVAYLQLAEPVLKSDPSSALKMSWEQDFIITLENAGETDLIITDSIKFRHDAITHRDLPDSHPISAISGLAPELEGIISDRDSTRSTKVITSNYTVLNTDSGILEVNATSGNIVITMAKSTSHIAKELLIIRTDSSANTVTVNPTSGDTFNGEGFSYSVGTVTRYEPTLFKAGIDYWTGVRSGATQLSNRNGLQIIDKGAILGQPVLMSNRATTGSLGVVRIGSNLSIDGNGILSGNAPYSLPNATTSVKGGVIVGANIDVSSGTISVKDATTTDKGVSQLATGAEAATGTNAVKTLTPSTLRSGLDATGSAPVYAARAFAAYNGSIGTLEKGKNITSVTKNGVGDYTFYFATAMPDANYAVLLSGCRQISATAIDGHRAVYARTTTSFSVKTQNTEDMKQDHELITAVVFG